MGNPQFRAQTAELGAVWDLEPGLLGGFSVGHGGMEAWWRKGGALDLLISGVVDPDLI